MRQNNTHSITPARAGFTLIELMITVVVVSVLLGAAYQLFASTSESMYEADSLADTVTDARFGLELLARDVQSAGSLSTPDSLRDTLVFEEQLGAGTHVYGIYAYQSRVYRQIEPVQSVFNPATAADEIVLLGAYDFPISFEIGFPLTGALNRAVAPNTQRGALRFTQLNPFDNRLLKELGINALSSQEQAGIVQAIGAQTHVLRLTDRNGYMQFSPLAAQPTYNVATGMTFELTTPFRARVEGGLEGLEPQGQEDVRYEASLLDALRYRVCIDPTDVGNLQLVKERLAAPRVISSASRIEAPEVCGTLPAGVLSQAVLADRVADFRVWYSCADTTTRRIEGRQFFGEWTPPYTEAQNGCAYLTDAGEPAEVTRSPMDIRMVHLRLSVHTDKERQNVPNYGFITNVGSLTDTFQPPSRPLATGPVAPGAIGGLQTFDFDGNPETSARVTTLQVDVSVKNFGNRERIQTVERDPTRGF